MAIILEAMLHDFHSCSLAVMKNIELGSFIDVYIKMTTTRGTTTTVTTLTTTAKKIAFKA